MSADLLEAFGEPQVAKPESRWPASKSASNLLIETEVSSKAEDTWQPWPKASTEPLPSFPDRTSKSLWETDEKGSDVLFDASEIDAEPVSQVSEDDFGDFEQVKLDTRDNGVPHIEPRLTSTDLLDFEAIGIEAEASRPSSQHRVDRGDSHPTTASIPPVEPSIESDGDWGDFETTEAAADTASGDTHHDRIQPRVVASKFPNGANSKNDTALKQARSTSIDNKGLEEEPWDDFESDGHETRTSLDEREKSIPQTLVSISAAATDDSQRDRPTNMPPPAVLLAWVQKLFTALAAEARRPDGVMPTGVLSLQAYRVCARVIAGRSLRWKRDTILSQSMRIGAAGRSGGMKLTVLDKGESRKEDQAVEEAIASWTRFSHILNAAITKAKAQKPPMALSNKLSARPATGLDVVNSPLACATCGLRRNERVIGIDVGVTDTFGEFWIEHWGHKDCADVWYRFNRLLDHR